MTKAKDNMYLMALDAQYSNIRKKDKQSVESFLKRRDKRYRDKQEVEQDTTLTVNVVSFGS